MSEGVSRDIRVDATGGGAGALLARYADARRNIEAAGRAFQRKQDAARSEAALAALPKIVAEPASAAAAPPPVPAGPPPLLDDCLPDVRLWLRRADAPPVPRPITLQVIQKIVASLWRIDLNDILSERRAKCVVLPRHAGMWLAKHHTPNSYPAIGRAFGGRDHSTALHAVDRVQLWFTTGCAQGPEHLERLQRADALLKNHAGLLRSEADRAEDAALAAALMQGGGLA